MSQPYTQPCDEGVIDAQPCPEERGHTVSRGTRTAVLAACVLASSMAFIDGSALTVALPDLRAHFGADLAFVQWVINGYVLALAALTLIGGALADVYGKARMVRLGCIGFGAASVACALAPNPESLVAARIVQGIAAAIVTPGSLALIGAVFPKSSRNRAIGIWAAASALTTAGGPVLGGFLTEHFGWQSIFWINVPLAALAVTILAIAAPRDVLEARRFDLPGAGLAALAMGTLAWALSQIGPGEAGAVGQAGHGQAMVGPASTAGLALSAVFFLVFAFWQRRSDHPMTPPRLFANRPFTRLNMATLLIYAGLSVMFFLLPFDLIDRRGVSATQAGMIFLPFTLGVGLLSHFFGGLADKWGAKPLLILGPAGAGVAYLAMGQLSEASLTWGVLVPMGFLGLSFASFVAPLTASVMGAVQDADTGLASGINNAASRVAQLVGVALAAGVAGYAGGYAIGLALAAAFSLAGASVMAVTRETALTQTRS